MTLPIDLSDAALAQTVDLERYGDPEKARMKAALEAIRELAQKSGTGATGIRAQIALGKIETLARQGLAP